MLVRTWTKDCVVHETAQQTRGQRTIRRNPENAGKHSSHATQMHHKPGPDRDSRILPGSFKERRFPEKLMRWHRTRAWSQKKPCSHHSRGSNIKRAAHALTLQLVACSSQRHSAADLPFTVFHERPQTLGTALRQLELVGWLTLAP